ncbi:MAG: hypothetical protein ACJ8LM_17800, partial [Candidatus Udaeobacter sp.]
ASARRQLVQQLMQTGRIAEARAQLQLMVDQPATPADDAIWARRRLAVNLTMTPSLASLQKSLQMLESNASNGRLADDDLRAKATVFAAQRSRLLNGKSARHEAIRLLSEIQVRTADDEILLARMLRCEGDTGEYLKCIGRLDRDHANSLAAQVFLAEEALRSDDLDKADRHIAAAQRIDASRFDSLVIRCARLARAGQSEQIKEIFQQYIRDAQEGNPRAARQIRSGHAVFEMLQSLPLGEQSATVFALRECAIEWYRAGMGRDPQALLNLISLMCKAGRTADALEFLQTQTVRAAFSFEAQAAAFATAARQGQANAQQLQAVERLLKSWTQKQPGAIAIQLALADIYETQKQTNKATFVYRDILERDPTNLNALNNLAWTWATEPDKMSDALRMINQAIDQHGHLDELLDTRGRILFAAGQQADGIRDLVDAVMGSPSAGRYFQLAVLYRRANQQKSADAALIQARRYGLTPADVLPQDVADYLEMMAKNRPTDR